MHARFAPLIAAASIAAYGCTWRRFFSRLSTGLAGLAAAGGLAGGLGGSSRGRGEEEGGSEEAREKRPRGSGGSEKESVKESSCWS